MLMLLNARLLTVGSPIEVQQCDKPEPAMVDAIHKQYMDALSDLFDKHKVECGIDAEMKLHFV
jgi:hypothetical protein